MTIGNQNRFWERMKKYYRHFLAMLHDIVILLMALVYSLMLYYLLTSGSAH